MTLSFWTSKCLGPSAAFGSSPTREPHTVPSTQERQPCVSSRHSAPLNHIITSVFLKNQPPPSADSCSLPPRCLSSLIGCAGRSPGSFLPKAGNSGWKCVEDRELGVGGDTPSSLPSLGCCHDSQGDRHVLLGPPPPSFSLDSTS